MRWEEQEEERKESEIEFNKFRESTGLLDDTRSLSSVAHKLQMLKFLKVMEEQRPDLFVDEVRFQHCYALNVLDKFSDDYEISLDSLILKVLNNPDRAADDDLNYFAYTLSGYILKFNFSDEVINALLREILKRGDASWDRYELSMIMLSPNLESELVEQLKGKVFGLNITSPSLDEEFLTQYGFGPRDLDHIAPLVNPFASDAQVREAFSMIKEAAWSGLTAIDGSTKVKLTPERYELLYAICEENDLFGKRYPADLPSFLISNEHTPKHLLQAIYDNNPSWRDNLFQNHPLVNRSEWQGFGARTALQIGAVLEDPEDVEEIFQNHMTDGYCQINIIQNPHTSEEVFLKALKGGEIYFTFASLLNKNYSPELRLFIEFKNLYPVYDEAERKRFEQKARELAKVKLSEDCEEVPLSYIVKLLSMHLDLPDF